MSAVIWCGIVAVWIFVLIPTWVRRGDIHWRRGAAVVAQGPASTGGGRGRRVRVRGRQRLRRSRTDQSVEVETMEEQVAQSQAAERVSAAAAPRVRVAAAPSSGRLGGAIRASFGTGPKGSGRKKPALRVRRARRLVALAALVLGTLVVAVLDGGMLIVVTLVADVALLLYLRHLRGIARERQAKALREKRARAARQAWEKASAQDRASHLEGWRAPLTDPEADEPADTSAHIDLTSVDEQPVVDLADAPTEELIAAQAS